MAFVGHFLNSEKYIDKDWKIFIYKPRYPRQTNDPKREMVP